MNCNLIEGNKSGYVKTQINKVRFFFDQLLSNQDFKEEFQDGVLENFSGNPFRSIKVPYITLEQIRRT
jgi:hypothetical protein